MRLRVAVLTPAVGITCDGCQNRNISVAVEVSNLLVCDVLCVGPAAPCDVSVKRNVAASSVDRACLCHPRKVFSHKYIM
jgi:hypothetical protein